MIGKPSGLPAPDLPPGSSRSTTLLSACDFTLAVSLCGLPSLPTLPWEMPLFEMWEHEGLPALLSPPRGEGGSGPCCGCSPSIWKLGAWGGG